MTAGLDRISLDPGVMGGRPCVRGMRVTIGMIVGQVGAVAGPAVVAAMRDCADDLAAGVLLTDDATRFRATLPLRR